MSLLESSVVIRILDCLGISSPDKSVIETEQFRVKDSANKIWAGRVNDLRRTGDLLADESILSFADFIEAQFIIGRKS